MVRNSALKNQKYNKKRGQIDGKKVKKMAKNWKKCVIYCEKGTEKKFYGGIFRKKGTEKKF